MNSQSFVVRTRRDEKARRERPEDHERTKLAGTVSVGEPGIPPAPGSFGATPISKTVAVEIFKAADGKATMKWVVDGATYQSTVDSCQSRNFTASAARSAIIVHLNPATTVTN